MRPASPPVTPLCPLARDLYGLRGRGLGDAVTRVQLAPGWSAFVDGRLVVSGGVLELPDAEAVHWCRRGWAVGCARGGVAGCMTPGLPVEVTLSSHEDHLCR